MDRVAITKEKLDRLAEVVGAKTGQGITLSLDEMTEAIKNQSTITIKNQSKIVTPTETKKVITPDEEYTGLDSVTVRPISSTYVGSEISRNDSNSLYSINEKVIVPAGFYSDSAVKAVPEAYLSTPTITVNSSTGVITSQVHQSSPGYIKVSDSRTSTYELPTQTSKVVTANDTLQTAVDTNKYTLGPIQVAPITLSDATVDPALEKKIITSQPEVIVNGGIVSFSGSQSSQISYTLNGSEVVLDNDTSVMYEIDAFLSIKTGTSRDVYIHAYTTEFDELAFSDANGLQSNWSGNIYYNKNYLNIKYNYTDYSTITINKLLITKYPYTKILGKSVHGSNPGADDSTPVSDPLPLDCTKLTIGKTYDIIGSVLYLFAGANYFKQRTYFRIPKVYWTGENYSFYAMNQRDSSVNSNQIYNFNFTIQPNSNEISLLVTRQSSMVQRYVAYDIDFVEHTLGDGFSQVTVNPIPSEYVIPNQASDLDIYQYLDDNVKVIDVTQNKYQYIRTRGDWILSPREIILSSEEATIPSSLINEEALPGSQEFDICINDNVHHVSSYDGNGFHFLLEDSENSRYIDLYPDSSGDWYFGVYDEQDQLISGSYYVAIFKSMRK